MIYIYGLGVGISIVFEIGRDLYRATPAVARDLGFSGLIRRTAPFSRLLRHTRGCGRSILTRILTGSGYQKEVKNVQMLTNTRYDVYPPLGAKPLPRGL
jgi:hypothetical protein